MYGNADVVARWPDLVSSRVDGVRLRSKVADFEQRQIEHETVFGPFEWNVTPRRPRERRFPPNPWRRSGENFGTGDIAASQVRAEKGANRVGTVDLQPDVQAITDEAKQMFAG
jgi:hypothetical protein